MRHALGGRREVRYRGRNILQRRCKGEREREQRAVQIERRQRIAARNDRYSGTRRDERNERLLNFQDDVAAARGDQWQIAQELDGVAETLLGVQQNPFAAERLAAPLRLFEFARLQVAEVPARLVFLPT